MKRSDMTCRRWSL